MGSNGAWPPEDLWLKKFLEDPKKNLLPCGADPLLDHKWWELLAHPKLCNGIDEPFLAEHFPRMAIWVHENGKPKTPGGWKRFVRNWLIKEAKRAGNPYVASRVSQQSRRDYKDR